MRWKNTSGPHADGLTGVTREMQEKRTPAKQSPIKDCYTIGNGCNSLFLFVKGYGYGILKIIGIFEGKINSFNPYTGQKMGERNKGEKRHGRREN